MFIKVTNGSPEIYTIGQLRRDNPSVSFPASIPDETLALFSVYKVEQDSRPNVDSKTHTLKQEFSKVGSKWVQQWIALELPAEEAAHNVRAYRNRLLAETDWTQIPDTPVDQSSWAEYRQELRNVPQQSGFPFSVTWPSKSE